LLLLYYFLEANWGPMRKAGIVLATDNHHQTAITEEVTIPTVAVATGGGEEEEEDNGEPKVKMARME